MKTAKKLLLTSALVLGMFSGAHNANAASDDVDAVVNTRAAIQVVTSVDMDFGLLDVLIASQTGNVVLATDGTVTPSDASVVASGTPAAGVVTISTDGQSPLDITCSNTAVMKAGTDALNLSAVTIKATGGATGFTTDHACTGTLEASLITPTSADVVLAMGATIALGVGNLVVTGNKSYTTVGNTPVTLTAVYH